VGPGDESHPHSGVFLPLQSVSRQWKGFDGISMCLGKVVEAGFAAGG